MPVKFNKIRALSLVVINHNNKTLVSPGYDKVKKSNFYRLLGGGVKFSETSLEALKREIKEELGLEITEPVLLNVEENIFNYNGEPAHEICFFYKADFLDKDNYKKNEFQVLDSPSHRAIWLELNKDNINKIKPGGSLSVFKECLNHANEGDIK